MALLLIRMPLCWILIELDKQTNCHFKIISLDKLDIYIPKS